MADLQQWGESLIGKVIADKYKITNLLGIGGAGGVFLATHTVLNSSFALKLIVPNPHAGTMEEQEKRFVREAATSLNLVHPRIVQVRDFGVDREREVMYMAMDFVQGYDLADILDTANQGTQEGEPLIPFTRALKLIHMILDALTVAHAAGIVHRDLKPGNVILLRQGEEDDIRILDFGFAKIRADSLDDKVSNAQTRSLIERITLTGSVLGTPQYMAPEQARGKDVDHRADLYAVGVMLYEMLTGVLPHTGSNLNHMLFSRATEPPRPLEEVRPDIEFPDTIKVVLEFALATDPENRFADTAQFMEMLDESIAVLGDGIDEGEEGVAAAPALAPPPVTAGTAGPASGSGLTDAAAVAAAVSAAVSKAISDSGGYAIPEDIASVLEKQRVISGHASATILAERRRSRVLMGIVGAMLVLGAIIAALALYPREDGYATHMNAAATALSQNKWKEAVASYERALAIRPGDIKAADSIIAARRGEKTAYLEKAWKSRNTPILKQALAKAKGILDDETYEVYQNRVDTLEDIPRIDDMLKRRRYQKALDTVNLRLDNGPHPNDVKKKLDSQHTAARSALALAAQYLATGRAQAGKEDAASLQKGVTSLTRFVDTFPHHVGLSEAKTLLARMTKTIAARDAARTSVFIETAREGHACYVDDAYVGPTNRTLSRKKISLGEHSVRFVDEEGFESTHTFEVTVDGQTRRLFDHDAAVAPERTAYERVAAAAKGTPEGLRAACLAYLKTFPKGAKREAVNTSLAHAKAELEEKVATDATDDYVALAALRKDSSATLEARVAAATTFTTRHPDSEHAPSVLAWLKELRAERDELIARERDRDAVLEALDSAKVGPRERVAMVARHLERFSKQEFAKENAELVKRLLIRPLELKGRLAMSRPAGKTSALVVTRSPASVAIYDLHTGNRVAGARLGSGEVISASAAPDGNEAYLGTRSGALFRWTLTDNSVHEVHAFNGAVRQVVALGDGRAIAAGTARESAILCATTSDGKTATRKIKTVPGVVTASAATADRSLVAFADDRGSVAVLHVTRRGAFATAWSVSVGGPAIALAFSPKGEVLAVSYSKKKQKRTTVYHTKKGKRRLLADHSDGSGWLQVLAPDGRVLVGGVVLGPTTKAKPVALKVGAASTVDVSGVFLLGADRRGDALICYLPEILRHVARARGLDG